MAFFLLISVRLDNIGFLGAQPSTVHCLMEKGAKTVTHLQAAEKLSVSVNTPQAVPWSEGGHTFSTVNVPLPWRSCCHAADSQKRPYPFPQHGSPGWKRSTSHLQLWLTWGMIQVTAHREAVFLAVRGWCVDYPLCHEKLTKAPPFLSLFSCKFQEPSQQMWIKESLQEKTGFNAEAFMHGCPVLPAIFQCLIYDIIHYPFLVVTKFGCN